MLQFSSVQSVSRVQLFTTPWISTPGLLSITNSWVHSNSCPLSQWCHPAISSSVTHFSSFPQSSPASGSYLMSQLFSSDGQSIGVSASASFFPMNIQGWFFFRIDWFGLCWSPTDSQESSPALQLESINSLALSLLYDPTPTSLHDSWKNHSFE